MKEITRIHIAKVAYSSELDAKKLLESYLKTLEAYADDSELLADIEIRMTELLAERGVLKDGVITLTDVEAIKKQLGDPRDFMGEGDIALGAEELIDSDNVRRFYRDLDTAVLGGVLGGIAAYFKVNAIWVRLLAIFLLFISFGTASLLYAVLWIVMPGAQTATQRLQMSGRPVTIQAIREINENTTARIDIDDRIAMRKRIVAVFAGFVSVVASIGALSLTIFAILAWFADAANATESYSADGWVLTAFIMAVASGVLLSVLFIITAYAAFSQRFSRRILISICVVIATGILAFGGAFGVAIYGSRVDNNFKYSSMAEKEIALPAGLVDAKRLDVASKEGMSVQYVVSDKPRVVLWTNSAKHPTINVTEGLVTVVSSSDVHGADVFINPSRLTIYGPALDAIVVQSGDVEYEAAKQDILQVELRNDSSFELSKGVVTQLNSQMGEGTSLEASAATVATADLQLQPDSSVELGAIKSLTATVSPACPAQTTARITAWKIADASIKVNGSVVKTEAIEQNCMELTIGPGEEMDGDARE